MPGLVNTLPVAVANVLPFWEMRCEGQGASEIAPAERPAAVGGGLRLAERGGSLSGIGLRPDGVEIPCDLREIEHPEGRFRRENGRRYDICVMEVLTHPHLRAPAVSRANFVGDCADNRPGVIRLGNVRQSSFRLCLISPGDALGTLAAAAKSSATVAI
jgi:hypothetical protein